MKNLKRCLIPSLILLSGTTFAQNSQSNCSEPIAFDSIDANHLEADLTPHSRLLNGDMGNRDGLTVEDYDGIEKTLVYASGLWLGGYDSYGDLLVATSRYGSAGIDYWAGPLDGVTGETTASACENFDRVWKVERGDIWTLLNDKQDDGVVNGIVPQSLLEWPGQGNPYFAGLLGFSLPNQDLAPFYDFNNDGIYDPYDGDYPVFEHGNPDAIAEQILWSVFNDNGNIHTESQSMPIGIEVQVTAYAFSCNVEPVLDNALFFKYKIINRQNTFLSDFRIGFWNDFDIGGWADDYFGTDSTLNTIYAYNADSIDEGSTTQAGFGEVPPVVALTLLSENIQSTLYDVPPSFGTHNPNALARYRLMGGIWEDGTPLTEGGSGFNINQTNETAFIYTSYPSSIDSNAWSMPLLGAGSQDIRAFMNTGRDTLLAQQQLELDIAYTYMRDTNLTGLYEMTNLVPIVVPQVQAIYDDGFSSVLCAQHPLLSTEFVEEENMSVSVFPNPNTEGQLTVILEDYNAEWGIEIVDVMGRIIKQEFNVLDAQFVMDVSDLESGIYFYNITNNTQDILSSGKLLIN